MNANKKLRYFRIFAVVIIYIFTFITPILEKNHFVKKNDFSFVNTNAKPYVKILQIESPQLPTCSCDTASKKYIKIQPCAGLVNQQYVIANGAIIAARLGADLYVESMVTRDNFHEPKFIESARLPVSAFYKVPMNINFPDGKVNVVDNLPYYLRNCTFPEDLFQDRKRSLESLSYMHYLLNQSCGINVLCPFFGIRVDSDTIRQKILTVLGQFEVAKPIQFLVEQIRRILENSSVCQPSSMNAQNCVVPSIVTANSGRKAYAAIHLRIEPDMNNGQIMPIPLDSIIQQLHELHVPKGTAIYIASGLAEDIMDQLPEGYLWFNRFNIISSLDETSKIARNLSAEQLALVDLEVCKSATYFIGDVRSTFSLAAAIAHHMKNVS